jgi:putative glutamine amidotransferase
MEQWGESTHAVATKVHADRQAFELRLFELLEARPELPVLAVCLGMQLMGLHAGGTLAQHLPESHPASAEAHRNDNRHAIQGELGSGVVCSRHHQALTSAGGLEVVARADDGMIEAIQDKSRTLYLGVQWHPERTADKALGETLFRQLVDAARARISQPA